MRYSLLILFSLLFYTEAAGQKDTLIQKNDPVPNRFYLLQKVKRGGETLPEIEIKEVAVVGRMQGSPRREQSQFRKYQRLVYNLKKVYPFARIVREKLAEANGETSLMGAEKGR